MNGSKVISMTIDEVKAAQGRGESRSDWARLQAEKAAGMEPSHDDDSPDATAVMRKAIASQRMGRPVGTTKTQIALRVDNDVLGAFRSCGKGWQTKMNEALREWLKNHSPA